MRISCLDVSLFFIPGLLEMASPTWHFSLWSDCSLIGLTDILVLLCVPPEQKKRILYFAPYIVNHIEKRANSTPWAVSRSVTQLHPLVRHTDEFWVSRGWLNGTHTGNIRGPIVLLVVHMAFNPPLDTNMAKLAICVKGYSKAFFKTAWLHIFPQCNPQFLDIA